MKTIKIAPNLDEIEVGANYVSTEWNGGIRYEAEGLDRYKEDYLKQCFSSLILPRADELVVCIEPRAFAYS